MEGDVYLPDSQYDFDVANDIGLCHGRNPKSNFRSSLEALIGILLLTPMLSLCN